MWKTVKLGDACLVRRGTTITRKQTVEGDVPVIGGGTKPTYFHNRPNRDANCITVSGSGASAGFVNRWDLPIFASDCSTVEPKDETQLHKFIYYYLMSQQQFIYDNFRSGAAQPHVYARDLETLEFPIFPLAEQQKIVEKLDKAFEEIDRATVSVNKSLKHIDTIFKSTLDQSVNAEALGEETMLDTLCTLSQGLAINKSTKHLLVKKSSQPLLRIKDLISDTVEQYVTDSYKNPKTSVNEDDLIFTRTGSLGLVFKGRKGILHNNSFKVETNKEMSSEYMYWWLQNPSFLKSIHSIAGKAAQPDISHKLFKSQPIRVPSICQQGKIVRKIEDIKFGCDSIHSILKIKSEKLVLLKSAILAKELKGPES